MGWRRRLLYVGLVALAVGGWVQRDRLRAPWAQLQRTVAPAAGAPVQVTPDVLYSWVDADGVTHYEQDTRQGQRLEYNGRRITPVAPVDPDLADRVREAGGAGEGAAGMAATGPDTLDRLRQEAHRGARQVQAAKAARHPDL